MADPIPILLVPGLNCSPRLYGEQIPALWRFGPVAIVDHTRDESIAAIAGRILDHAPPRFALAGLSMGGYIAFEIVRQAPERVTRLALIDTSPRLDTPAQTVLRRQRIAKTQAGRFLDMVAEAYPTSVHPSRRDDAALRAIYLAMARDVGPEAYLRQQAAIMGRADARPLLAHIRCPTLVAVGDADTVTPPDCAQEMADGIRGARLVTFSDCGHVSSLERPEAVTAALVDWLGG